MSAAPNPRQPWRLGGGRRLGTADWFAHLDDLVRIVLLTGPNERLHRPAFGAGLGASTLFEPLSDALGPTITARVRGSLDDALGGRIQVLDVTVTVADSTVSASLTYRPLPAGDNRTVVLELPGAGT